MSYLSAVPFYCWIVVVFQWINIPQFVYPCICWWTFGLFSVWLTLNKAVYEHSWISSFVDMCFHFFLGKSLEVELLGYAVSVCLKTVFPRPEFRGQWKWEILLKAIPWMILEVILKNIYPKYNIKPWKALRDHFLKSGLKVRLKMEDPVKRTPSLEMT